MSVCLYAVGLLPHHGKEGLVPGLFRSGLKGICPVLKCESRISAQETQPLSLRTGRTYLSLMAEFSDSFSDRHDQSDDHPSTT